MEDALPSTTNNGRSSHTVGRLGSLIRDNDEFFELISSKFLTESRYSATVQAATIRLLYSCSLTWTYPHVFEGQALAVLDKLKGLAMDETLLLSSDDRIWKNVTGKRTTSDSDMLRTYSTGLLAVCLTSGAQIVEDVIDGLSSKLMRYLRYRVLGESSMNQTDANQVLENRNSSIACTKTGEEARGRLQQVTEGSHSDMGTLRLHTNERDRERDPSSFVDFDKDRERRASKKKRGDECWIDDESPGSVAFNADGYVAEADGEENCNTREYRDLKTKPGGKLHREEDSEETMREDPSRRRTNKGILKSRGKNRSYEGASEHEQAALTSPGPANRSGPARSFKDRSAARTQDLRRTSDAKKGLVGNNPDAYILERDDNDECFQGCKVGSRDITDFVKKAIRAAEEEARAIRSIRSITQNLHRLYLRIG